MQQLQQNQVWGPQQIIIRSKDEQALLKAAEIQTDMLHLFFAVADRLRLGRRQVEECQAPNSDNQDEKSPQ
jgi:hypothetical protein